MDRTREIQTYCFSGSPARLWAYGHLVLWLTIFKSKLKFLALSRVNTARYYFWQHELKTNQGITHNTWLAWYTIKITYDRSQNKECTIKKQFQEISYKSYFSVASYPARFQYCCGQGKHSTEVGLLATIDQDFTLRKRKETNKVPSVTRRGWMYHFVGLWSGVKVRVW